MPIRQQTVIEILEAALDYRFAFTEYRRLIKSALDDGDVDRLRELTSRRDHEYLTNPIETTRVLAYNEEHIRLTRRHNQWRAIRDSRTSTLIEDPLMLKAAKEAGYNTAAEWVQSLTGGPASKSPSLVEPWTPSASTKTDLTKEEEEKENE